MSDAATTSLWGTLLVEECLRNGVDHFVVAPGARSTPVVAAIGAAVARGEATAKVITDERSAAFYALGYGRATGRPAVMVTTSGSAMGHALPAVLEAEADRVPMLLLSADRPPELTGTGANQTAEQTQLLRGYVRHAVDLPVPDAAIDPAFVLTTVDEALHLATAAPAGPVHLNCRFRKPLEPVAVTLPETLHRWRDSGRPWTQWSAPTLALSSAGRERLTAAIRGAERGLLVVGGLRDATERAAAQRIAEGLGWPVYADVTSSLAGSPGIEAMLASARFRTEFAPDVVLHLGGRVVSQRLWSWVVESEPTAWIVARPDPWRLDPAHRVTERLVCDIAEVSSVLSPIEAARPTPRSLTLARLSGCVAAVVAKVDREEPGLSEVGVARVVTAAMPGGAALWSASSMPIRDLDRFGHRPQDGAWHVVSNRGVSGIDGTLASAVGYAAGTERPVVVLIGDQAFLHDVGSVGLLAGTQVTVVVVNNDGGGIFSFLPIADHEPLHTDYFVAAGGQDIRRICAGFGVDAQRAEDEADLAALLATPGRVIEVVTDRDANRALHTTLDTAIVAAVAHALEQGDPPWPRRTPLMPQSGARSTGLRAATSPTTGP